MEKWMIVYLLPLEVWMDIFCFPWITREKFGQIVDKIGNFKFAENAQFYLHEWGKRQLNKVLCIDQYGLYKHYYSGDAVRPYRVNLDIPQAPLPKNIKSFVSIRIYHFDAKTMDFLGRIGSLLTDVGIRANVAGTSEGLRNLRTALTNMAPFVNGIRSLWFDEPTLLPFTLPMVRQCFSRDVFAKLKVLQIHFPRDDLRRGLMRQPNVNIIVDWLTQPDNGGPKLCEFDLFYDNGFFEQFARAVRQQFHAARTPSTFAVNFNYPWSEAGVDDEFHLENNIGEELHGVLIEHAALQITRHQAGCETELQEWIKANTEDTSHGSIALKHPTVGKIDWMCHLPRVGDKTLQPCSSKDA